MHVVVTICHVGMLFERIIIVRRVVMDHDGMVENGEAMIILVDLLGYRIIITDGVVSVVVVVVVVATVMIAVGTVAEVVRMRLDRITPDHVVVVTLGHVRVMGIHDGKPT